MIPPGSIDCEPLLLPVACVVPVAGTYDHPVDAAFSLDGTTALRPQLRSGERRHHRERHLPPDGSAQPEPYPHGRPTLRRRSLTAVAAPRRKSYPRPWRRDRWPLGQQLPLRLLASKLQTSGAYKGLFAGNLTLINLSTYTAGGPISISDGSHNKMLFADNNTPVDRLLAVCQRRSRRRRCQGVRRHRHHRSGRQLQLPHPGSTRIRHTHRADHPCRNRVRNQPRPRSLPQHQSERVLRPASRASAGSRTTTRSTQPTAARSTPSTPDSIQTRSPCSRVRTQTVAPRAPRSTTTTLLSRAPCSTSLSWTPKPTAPTNLSVERNMQSPGPFAGGFVFAHPKRFPR